MNKNIQSIVLALGLSTVMATPLAMADDHRGGPRGGPGGPGGGNPLLGQLCGNNADQRFDQLATMLELTSQQLGELSQLRDQAKAVVAEDCEKHAQSQGMSREDRRDMRQSQGEKSGAEIRAEMMKRSAQMDSLHDLGNQAMAVLTDEQIEKIHLGRKLFGKGGPKGERGNRGKGGNYNSNQYGG